MIATVDKLTDEQSAFKKAVLGWFAKTGNTPPLVLTGAAGCGKTFTLSHTVAALIERYDGRLRIAFCAPTHRAVGVLSAMRDGAGVTGNNNFMGTLHSLLHLKLEFNSKGEGVLLLNRNKDRPYYTDFDLVIIDEVSMISQDLLDMIPVDQTATIFAGDMHQLPPVEPQAQKALIKMPAFEVGKRFELTKVHRYRGALAQYADVVRQTGVVDDPNSYADRQTLFVYDTHQDWLDAMDITAAKKRVGGVKAIAFTNTTADKLNTRLRAIVTPSDKDYVVNDCVIAADAIPPVDIVGNTLMLHYDDNQVLPVMFNSQSGTVSSVEDLELTIPGMGKTPIKGHLLEVRSENGFTEVFCAAKDEYPRLLRVLVQLKRTAIGSGSRAAWIDYYGLMAALGVVVKGRPDHPKLLPRLTYDFASTVHKSQGGAIDYAFIHGDELIKQSEKLPLFYTALTRARKEAHILLSTPGKRIAAALELIESFEDGELPL
jgi:exodeoxyribonuclease V